MRREKQREIKFGMKKKAKLWCNRNIYNNNQNKFYANKFKDLKDLNVMDNFLGKYKLSNLTHEDITNLKKI